MRLYLSSFHIGDHPERLLAMVRSNARVAVIANAIDTRDPARRAAWVQYEVDELGKLGLDGAELDLRHYFGHLADLAAELARYDLLLVRGGSTFMLRHALAESRADELIKELLTRDAIANGGYSAGYVRSRRASAGSNSSTIRAPSRSHRGPSAVG
jgi:dipeptidase E